MAENVIKKDVTSQEAHVLVVNILRLLDGLSMQNANSILNEAKSVLATHCYVVHESILLDHDEPLPQ